MRRGKKFWVKYGERTVESLHFTRMATRVSAMYLENLEKSQDAQNGKKIA